MLLQFALLHAINLLLGKEVLFSAVILYLIVTANNKFGQKDFGF